jgi:hypothetical protein
VLAVSAEAGEGWEVTEEFLRSRFAGPRWTGTRVEPVDVVARTVVLPGFLLRTVRSG